MRFALRRLSNPRTQGPASGAIGGAYTLEQMGRGMEAEEAYRQSLKNADKPSLLNRVWEIDFRLRDVRTGGCSMDTLIGP